MSCYGQEVGCTAECVERHLLVETLEHFGMSGLQAHGDFEPTGYQISKPQTPFSIRTGKKRRVRFDDHTLEPGHSLGDLFVIVRRDRRGVEEAAGVVQLDVPRRRQRGDGIADLRGDRASRHCLIEGVDPEIAHHAPERTLPVREKDYGSGGKGALAVSLLFPYGCVRAMSIERSLGRSMLENEAIERCRV